MFWRKKVQIFHFPHSQRNSFTAKFKLCGSLYGRKWSPSRNKSFAPGSRKRAARTRFWEADFRLSIVKNIVNTYSISGSASVTYSFRLAKTKIGSLKILRPAKSRITSRFWCGGCGNAIRLPKTTSRKMPELCLYGRAWTALFRLSGDITRRLKFTFFSKYTTEFLSATRSVFPSEKAKLPSRTISTTFSEWLPFFIIKSSLSSIV